MTEEISQYKAIIGRPTLYDANILQKVNDYLQSCTDIDEKDNRRIRVNLPKVEGLARYLSVSKDTLYEWAKRHPDFSDALREIKNEQYCRLIDEGLASRYNPTIVKLMLSSNHGLTEVSKSINELVTAPELTEDEKEGLLKLLR